MRCDVGLRNQMTTASEKLSEKQKKQWIIAGVLILIFVGSFVKNVLLYKRKPALSSSATSSSAVSQENPQNLADDLLYVTNLRLKDKQFEDQTAVWKKDWGRDPFMPQAVSFSIVKAVNLVLNGILWDEAEPRAIVNERTLMEGDTIYGYTLVSIKPKSVTLRTGEKDIELYVFRPLSADPSASM